MAFEKIQTVTHENVGDIKITLRNANSASYSIKIIMSDGSIQTVNGDLVPHLDVSQRTGLIALMDDVRIKAQVLVN